MKTHKNTQSPGLYIFHLKGSDWTGVSAFLKETVAQQDNKDEGSSAVLRCECLW